MQQSQLIQLPFKQSPKEALAPERTTPISHLKNVDGYNLPMASEFIPAWRKMLGDIGYPMPIYVIDFETYFDDSYHLNTKKRDGKSIVEYVNDKRFEVLGVAEYRAYDNFCDPENTTQWHNGEAATEKFFRYLQTLYGESLSGCTLVAHNARFEASILGWQYGIFPEYVIDTVDLSRHWYTRRKHTLSNLCEEYGLTDKGNTEDFKGMSNRRRVTMPMGKKNYPKPPPIIHSVMTPDQHRDIGHYAKNDVMREWEIFTILMPRVSQPKVEFPLMQHTLNLYTKPKLHLDMNLADEIIEEMKGQTTVVIDSLNAIDLPQPVAAPYPFTAEIISKDGTFEEWVIFALLRVGDTPSDYMKPAKNKRGYKLAIAKDDEAFSKLMSHDDLLVRSLTQARAAIKSWPLHISRVRRIVAQSKAAGGLLAVPLKYHGTMPGRYAGGDRINLQNLGSRGHELISRVRRLLMAPEGKELVISDASQIQARILAWIAGEWGLVQKFESGEEIYCGFASDVLGVTIRKPFPEDQWKQRNCIPAIENYMKWARNQIGKTGVLGAGFGLGAARAVEYGKGAFDFATASKLIKTYRKKHPAIVKFWREIERAFVYTLKYGKPCSMDRGLRFYQEDGVSVIIVLPSGRELKYHEVVVSTDSHTGREQIRIFNPLRKSWDHLWGGTLTENVVMAMERDIVVNTSLQLTGHEVLQVHDEIILITDEGEGAALLERANRLLSERPSWGKELPLAAEGVVTTRYGGH